MYITLQMILNNIKSIMFKHEEDCTFMKFEILKIWLQFTQSCNKLRFKILRNYRC